MSIRNAAIARWLATALCVPVFALAACASAGPPLPDNSEVASMQQRFIIRYRDDSMPGKDRTRVVGRVEQALRDAGLATDDAAVQVHWLRRLGVGADVVTIEPGLDTAQSQRLLETLIADPDVAYAEPDSLMTIGPGPVLRKLKPLGE